MARLYLSFLGTTDYYPCTYCFRGLNATDVRFVQEATIQSACLKWSEEDRILIFTTHEAYNKNWLDNGHIKNGMVQAREGLHARLEKLNLQTQHKNVFIPEGKEESEIWEIFQIVFDQMGQNDEVVFDITHGFRSIPMLAMVILNYAKVLKNISIRAIYYGALEALGKMDEVKKCRLKKDVCPFLS